MDQTESPTVVTLGHSNRDLDHFLSLLSEYGVDYLIDVRSYPKSRFAHFNKDNLKVSLEEKDIRYEHWPELGGFRDANDEPENTALSEGFQAVAEYLNSNQGQASLDKLSQLILHNEDPETVALMCAEKDPDQCHRKLISDHLLVRWIISHHLIDQSYSYPHQLNQHAREIQGKVRYPGLV